ncbi:hypothetical protein B9Z51_09865 [Limnohabitans sp. T6-5]|uniref:lipoprotein insertase outer membrane protein LolB n=1 Tax=Limnohabitans sp. T6-5 TaxID=1100724 RepID=UPI000D35924C|nr:lipoprotein insertase outer membrane protein LolB [Limnohabitans sp. T6-5]PUE09206.1 hypothetical protein B9Z51_09865 [Limnohabitans sp. T6-5]
MRSPMLKGLAWLGLSALLALWLAGCATHQMPAPSGAYWSGRMAIQIQSDPAQQMSVSFELQGSAEQGDMLLLSPIGTTLAMLSWTPHSAWLEQNGQRTHSANLQSLSEQLTGTALPVSALFEWLAGRAANAPGWQVDLSAHPQGRVLAQRKIPLPEAVLRIVLDR